MYFIWFVFGITFASAQQCSSPNGDKGRCKSIDQCDVLRQIVGKAVRTSIDEQFLRKSKCGYDGKIPKVCCPDTKNLSCSTPDDNKGECINLHSCPHLLELLKGANKTANMEYVKNSVCAGPSEYSVCCGPAPDLSDPVDTPQCERTVSALPPDPDGDCCGLDSTVGNKIIGGNATTIDQYPWVVVIEYVKPYESRKLLCGGGLISGKYVLTAAHCVTGPILQRGIPKYVRLGEYNVTNDGADCVMSDFGDADCTDDMILAPIEELIPHPEYTGLDLAKRHDIALIRLKIYAPYTDFIRPICLPKTDYLQSPPPNFSFYVAGWGRAFQNATINRSSDVKKHVKIPYVDRDTCQAAIRTLPGVKDIVYGDGQICAGALLGQSTCKGDSGGPLMYESEMRKYEAIGLVSTGPTDCGREGIPTVFIYIYKYLPWIKATIKP